MLLRRCSALFCFLLFAFCANSSLCFLFLRESGKAKEREGRAEGERRGRESKLKPTT